jgi:hypothetical protein
MTKEEKKSRPKRTPVGTRNILRGKDIPGYYVRWVNDTGDRIEVFKEAGYTPVYDADGDQSDKRAQNPKQLGSVVRKHVGGGVYAVLMKIPLEWYQEDQALKQQRVDEAEEAVDPARQLRGNEFYGSKLIKK